MSIIRGSDDPGARRPDGPWQDLASFSSEQTARFFAGGEIGAPAFADPEIQNGVDRQRKAMREALRVCRPIMLRALHAESPETEGRLAALWAAADRGDQEAKRLLIAIVGELVNLAYTR